MSKKLKATPQRAEHRAAIGQRPMAFARHGQSAGTARVRAHLAKPAARSRDSSTGRITIALAPPGARPTYSSDEGLS
jgi:hypothetical protein